MPDWLLFRQKSEVVVWTTWVVAWTGEGTHKFYGSFQ